MLRAWRGFREQEKPAHSHRTIFVSCFASSDIAISPASCGLFLCSEARCTNADGLGENYYGNGCNKHERLAAMTM